MKPILLLTTLMLGALAVSPLAAGATDASTCRVATTAAFSPTGGFYLAGATAGTKGVGADVWLETNDLAGLQKGKTFCADGRVIPADTCLSRMGTSVTYCPSMAIFTMVP